MATEAPDPKPYADLEEVLRAERDFLLRHRHDGRDPDRVARSLVGLALSGGGIRSATTNLGILQALSRVDILPLVDYLSTVSGGGYIGACLTSLLSWKGRRVAGDPSPGAPYTYGGTERTRFTTSWPTFPFRADEVTGRSRVGRAIVGHLRTHGNFLIARLGVLRREMLRGVSHIVLGLVCNLAMFALTIFAGAAFYLAAANFLAPDLEKSLGVPVPASQPVTVAPLVATDSSVVRVNRTDCVPGSPGCAVEIRTTLQPPTLLARLQRNAGILTAAIRRTTAAGGSAAVATWRGIPIPTLVLLIALAFGGLLSVVVFVWMLVAQREYLKQEQSGSLKPGRGESAEDVFERSVLVRLGVLALALSGGLLWWLWVWRKTVLLGADQLVLFVLPLAFFAGGFLFAFLISTLVLPHLSAWTRRMRSLWGSYVGITIYGTPVMLLFGVAPLVIYALRDHPAGLGLGGIASLVAARVLTSRDSKEGAPRFSIPARLRNWLLGGAVVLSVLLLWLYFAALVARSADTGLRQLAIGLIVLVVLIVFATFVHANRSGPNYFYRDRLAETYLLSERPDSKGQLWTYRDAMEMPLDCLHGRGAATTPAFRNTSPYHLISAAINLAGSRDLTRRDRKSGYWLFSRLYCGSEHTGFRLTSRYRGGTTTLARAVAVSGAAVGAAMGHYTFFAQAFASVLFNLRLDFWMENPALDASERAASTMFWPGYLWREVTMDTTETMDLVNLSDGGHTGDNVGIYPLLQRRCKVVIACDAENDERLAFGSFTEALRHAYIDMGVKVDIDLSMIRRDEKTGYSRAHCAVGRIHYPDRPDQESFIIYLKNSLTGDEPEPVLNYQTKVPIFPHETTGDQFFTDAQFESYRALGEHIAADAFRSWVHTSWFDAARMHHGPVPVP
ncbi:MAG TPA: hypothetical protein VF981_03365 [Gemmatimonadaceae bacterium]